MTMDNVDFEVTTSPSPSTPRVPDKPTINSYNTTNSQEHEMLGMRADGKDPITTQAVLNVTHKNESIALTLIDSGASDHCFIDKALFITITYMHQPNMGLAASRELTFSIAGKGKAKIETNVNSITRVITFNNALYKPELRSNLISVSRLVGKGAKVHFDEHEAQVKSIDSTTIMMARRYGRLYAVKTIPEPPAALIVQVKQQAVAFDTWHRRLGHAAFEIIRKMAVKTLVNGLNITRELTMGEKCKDCIFGKYSTHSFNDSGYQETGILERIHVDIWGPSPIQSAGGAHYFMLLMDGHSSYNVVALLKSKSADVTLNIFETYHKEAERQTGKKLRQIRLDMGREWHNRAWEEYRK